MLLNLSEEKNEPDKKRVKRDDDAAADGTPFSFSALARENISEVRNIALIFSY